MQSRIDAPSALERVRQAARKDKKLRFTALLHHIYNLETLRMAYFSLKKEAAPGVDGETWRQYGEQLEGNLQDLSERLKRGAYRAKPVRRVYEAKAARSHGAGRQNCPACDGRGAEHHLRDGFSWFLVWVPAKAKPASGAGCALHGVTDEKSELGA